MGFWAKCWSWWMGSDYACQTQVLVWRTSSMMLCLSNKKSKRKAKDENREPARDRNCKVKKTVSLYQLRAEKFKVTISFIILLLRLQKRGIVWHEWRSILEVYSVCQVSLLLLFLPSPDKRRIIFFVSCGYLFLILNSLIILIFTFDEGICILNVLPLFLGPFKKIYCGTRSSSTFSCKPLTFFYDPNSLKATYSEKPIDEMSAKIGPIKIAQRTLTV